MQYRTFLLTTALAVVFSHTSFGQGPVGDEVMVTFDQSVQVGSHSLPAGKYTIRQVTSASNPRVLEFTSDNGTKLDATVAAIPVLQNTPTSKTRVILDNEGGAPRLARIWVQGKSYGYEFPGKGKSSATAGTVNLQGTFVAQAAPPASPQVVQDRTPEPARTPAPLPVAESSPRPADNAVIAQNRPAETPAAAPQSPDQNAASPDASLKPSDAAENPAGNVPTTALGWMQIVLLGMGLASAGSFLYWRERSKR
jgi:hypothetical protein